jgi:hypothetical protein
MVADEAKREFIKPIENATYPGTLAALSLAVLQVSGKEIDPVLKTVLLLGAMLFLISAFFIFFHTIYPKSRMLWSGTAITFIAGLILSFLSVLLLIGIG